MSPLRCAIYTRKSTEEGLEQAFNSLDAQREACAAYVLSQAGEGWEALPALYDDGGFSGGSIDRPALKRLLADIDAGLIDVVVVYKVDRLTRSLADFAKIVERFDARNVSFVSVTQAFNTTSSMGRLTLNVLLSFAQFEREVTAERIRDKIAMSKARGMWMGGMIPLGYDRRDGALVVNETEAEQVRTIFARYLELRSVSSLRIALEEASIGPKRWTSSGGRAMGASVFSRGALFHLLRNRLYIGEIVHKDRAHAGQHPAIVDAATFDAVQAHLKANCEDFGARPVKAASAALVGRVFDGDGRPMSPSFAYSKAKRIYRYYISPPLDPLSVTDERTSVRRVSAPLLENKVATALSRLLNRVLHVEHLRDHVERVELERDHIEVVFRAASARSDELGFRDICARTEAGEHLVWEDKEALLLRLRMEITPRLRGGRTWLDGRQDQPHVARTSNGLAEGLRAAHRELTECSASPLSDPASFLSARAPELPHQRQLSRLAFLAPDLQRQILDGEHPPALKLRTLLKTELPLSWSDQRAWFEGLRRARA